MQIKQNTRLASDEVHEREASKASVIRFDNAHPRKVMLFLVCSTSQQLIDSCCVPDIGLKGSEIFHSKEKLLFLVSPFAFEEKKTRVNDRRENCKKFVRYISRRLTKELMSVPSPKEKKSSS